MEHAAQRNCGCSISGCIQGQVGWCLGDTDLVGGDPVYGRVLKFDDF